MRQPLVTMITTATRIEPMRDAQPERVNEGGVVVHVVPFSFPAFLCAGL